MAKHAAGRTVRVNFEMDERLHRVVKMQAASEGRTISAIARELFEGWAS